MSNPTPNDPVIDEVREVRRRISAQFDHDPKKLVEHYIELQKRYAERLLVETQVADKGTDSAA
jgi:hypothetical protein